MEQVEVVDAEGRVERVVTRAEMRAGNLRHRAVYIAVRRPGDGALLVHRRADWKDVWPSRWDVAFGGVCGVGESWDDAARRELGEEAGIDASPTALGDGAYEDAEVAVVGRFYEVEHGGPFTFADGEVEETAWVAVEELGAWLADRASCPDSVALLRTIAPWARH